MNIHYRAYGLTLNSTFPLTGMDPLHDPALPALELDLLTPSELTCVWSGSQGPPVWRGTLGDGAAISVEEGVAGDIRIIDGERARFHLDPQREILGCAPLQLGFDWQHTLLSKVLAIVSLLRGNEAMHAAAVDTPHGAIAILAPGGTGKTTLAIELLRRSYPLLSDDVLALSASADGVVALPGTPHMNLAADGCAAGPDGARTLRHTTDERWVAIPETAVEPGPLRLIVLLQRARGSSLGLEVLPRSPLLLTPYMLGLLDDAGRARRRFELYADLTSAATLVRVTAGPENRPAEIVDLVLSARAGDPAGKEVGALT